MAKKVKQEKELKWDEYIDPTQVRAKSGKMRVGYRWTVRSGKYELSGKTTSYSAAEREQREAKSRIKEAVATKNKNKLIKPPKNPFLK
jgi:hypothetical protein